MSDWDVPHRGKGVITGTRARGVTTLVGAWEPVQTDDPVITYTSANDGYCLTEVAGVRCRRHLFHDGPCRVRVHAETGVIHTVAFGQTDTSAEPGWLPELTADLARARDIAVALEQQTAAVAALHHAEDLGTGEDHAISFCVECHQPAPCATTRALTDDTLDLTEGDAE